MILTKVSKVSLEEVLTMAWLSFGGSIGLKWSDELSAKISTVGKHENENSCKFVCRRRKEVIILSLAMFGWIMLKFYKNHSPIALRFPSEFDKLEFIDAYLKIASHLKLNCINDWIQNSNIRILINDDLDPITYKLFQSTFKLKKKQYWRVQWKLFELIS